MSKLRNDRAKGLLIESMTLERRYVRAKGFAGKGERRRSAKAARLSPAAALATAWLTIAAGIATANPAAEAHQSRSHPSARKSAITGAPSLPVTVGIDPLAPGRPVPPRFLGLSFEAAALEQLAQYARRGNLVKLLRSLGPGTLRFGGVTADQNVAWADAATPRPAWASSVIGPAELHAIGMLARRSGWQILLTVGLAHYEPNAAAREVAAAHRALGPYLAAVEIGNEPNAYGNHGFRELPWIAQGYQEEVSSYREAIGALTPGVPIAGPDVSGSGIFSEWGSEEALAQEPVVLTGHHYPLGCAQTPAPSIEALLSSATRGREAHSLETYMAVARNNGVPLGIDEANTVSCGGVAGVSNTFASALWATGYITQTMAIGAVGIALQGNPTNCAGYTPLCAPDPTALARGSLRAQPEWYALLLTRSLVGCRPLPTTITAEPSPNLVAAAFSGPGRSLKVALSNDEPAGTSPLAVNLEVGAGMGLASILRLTAPSTNATGGVRLAGHAVATDGSWTAPRRLEIAETRSGLLKLELPAGSAALVTVSRATATPRRRHRMSRR